MKKWAAILITLLLVALCAAAMADVVINETNFPGYNFRNMLEGSDYDKNEDGILSDEEISAITELSIQGRYRYAEYSNLNGIEYLTALKSLRIYNCDYLEEIDLSSNTELETIYITNSDNLKTLKLGNNTKLSSIYIDHHKLAELDLRGCSQILAFIQKRGLQLNSGAIYAGNDDGKRAVEIARGLDVIIDSNSRKVPVNAENFPDDAFRNYVSSKLDISGDYQLSQWEIDQVTGVDIDGGGEKYRGMKTVQGITLFPRLKWIKIIHTEITTLDVSTFSGLTSLYCTNNDQMTSLVFGNHPELTYLDCRDNKQLKQIDLTGCSQMKDMILKNNIEYGRDCLEMRNEGYTALMFDPGLNIKLDLSGKNIAVDESNFPDSIFRGRVSRFDLTRDGMLNPWEIQKARKLVVNETIYRDDYSEAASAAGIEHLTALEELQINNTQIATLDLTKNTALAKVSLGNNAKLTIVSLGSNDQLGYFWSTGNNLASVDLTGCSLLKTLIQKGTATFDPNNNGFGKVFRVRNTEDQTVLEVDIFTEPVLDARQERVAIDAKHFPDPLFRKYLTANYDFTKDGKLNQWETAYVTRISFDWTADYNELEDLTGIEYFPNLEYLDCSGKTISELDLRKNRKLQYLNCSNNRLASLDLSGNPALETLNCSQNRLIKLNTSANKALKELDCSQNQITALSLSKNTAMEKLECSNNQLKKLDLSKHKAMHELKCEANQISTLNLNGCSSMTSVRCERNALTALNISPLTKLVTLDCSENQLSKLDISKNKALKTLDCHQNRLEALNVSKNTKLKELRCQNNWLKDLDVSKCPDLLYLLNNSERQEGSTVAYQIYNQGLYLGVDKFVTIKAGNRKIPPTGEPYIAGEFSDSTGVYQVYQDKIAIFKAAAKKTATSVVVPATIKVIGVTVKVTGIGEGACKGMKKMTKLEIGKNVKSIGAEAFSGCAKLKTITGGKAVETIGDSAFAQCGALTAIMLESKVKQIGAKAYYKCKKLVTITIKTKSLTDESVGADAFGGTGKKVKVKCPKGKAKIYAEFLKAKGLKKATFQ